MFVDEPNSKSERMIPVNVFLNSEKVSPPFYLMLDLIWWYTANLNIKSVIKRHSHK